MGQSDAISGLTVGHLQLIVFSMVGFYRLLSFSISPRNFPVGFFSLWSPTCTFGYNLFHLAALCIHICCFAS
ncbi:hypothetical protein B0H14DRAFT_2789000 [Mycena olivaceomarginata]|nr:hypothetical protein B0H14DRAFT_2789000 [Mycena olivaceomarginata]